MSMRASLHRELAHGVVVALRAVTHLGEVGGHFLDGPGLSGGDVLGSGKQLRGVLQHPAGEAGVNHLANI